jgi:hypothetical protein
MSAKADVSSKGRTPLCIQCRFDKPNNEASLHAYNAKARDCMVKS